MACKLALSLGSYLRNRLNRKHASGLEQSDKEGTCFQMSKFRPWVSEWRNSCPWCTEQYALSLTAISGLKKLIFGDYHCVCNACGTKWYMQTGEGISSDEPIFRFWITNRLLNRAECFYCHKPVSKRTYGWNAIIHIGWFDVRFPVHQDCLRQEEQLILTNEDYERGQRFRQVHALPNPLDNYETCSHKSEATLK